MGRIIVRTEEREPHSLIRWMGSKSYLAQQIVANFPPKIATYYEPFLGDGSVLYELLGSDIEVDRIEVSNIYKPLIALWTIVKNDPIRLVKQYDIHWRNLQQHGPSYYYKVCKDFDRTTDPHLFFFLLRTSGVEQVRFNQAGEFNGSFNLRYLGIAPEKVEKLYQGMGSSPRNKGCSVSGT